MARELTIDDYLKAAKIVANCPRDRVAYVLQILAQSGMEIEELENVIERAKVEKTKHIYCKRRNDDKRDNWRDTTNPTTLLLRKAYDLNIGFTTLSRMCGVDRVTLYHYLRGTKTATEINAGKIEDTLTKMIAEITGEV